MATIEEYYEGEEHGDYQYVTFSSLVQDMVEDSLDQDSYLKNTARSQIIKWLKRGIRVMNFNALNAPKLLELTLPPSLTMVLPVDYVDWIRISRVDENGYLYALGENKNMNIAVAYLQDNEYEILFDNGGNPLLANSGTSAFQQPYNRLTFDPSCRGNAKTVDTSYYNENGEFKIDKEFGRIAFSSDLSEKNVILEYVSDGLEDEKIYNDDLKIHKYIIDAVTDYAYWQLIRKKRNVNATEKGVARHEYYNSRRIAKKRIVGIKVHEILKGMSGSSKWV